MSKQNKKVSSRVSPKTSSSSSSTPTTPSHSKINSSELIFSNQFPEPQVKSIYSLWSQLPSTYSSLKNPPVLKDSSYATFKEWKSDLANWADSKGSIIWEVISNDYSVMQQQAISAFTSDGYSISDAIMMFQDLNKRLWALLSIAAKPVLGSLLTETIQMEQLSLNNGTIKLLGTNNLKEGNVNLLWKRINSTFEKKTNYAALPLFRELINKLHDRGSESPMQFGQKITALIQRLQLVIKVQIPEQLQIAFLLNGLPKYYDTVIDGYLAVNQEPTLSGLVMVLQQYYERHLNDNKQQLDAVNGFGTAYSVSTISNTNIKQNRNGKQFNKTQTLADQL